MGVLSRGLETLCTAMGAQRRPSELKVMTSFTSHCCTVDQNRALATSALTLALCSWVSHADAGLCGLLILLLLLAVLVWLQAESRVASILQ